MEVQPTLENQHSLILEFATENWREYFKDRLDGPVQIVPRSGIDYIETIGTTTNDYHAIDMGPGIFVGNKYYRVTMLSYSDPVEEAASCERMNQRFSVRGWDKIEPPQRYPAEEVGEILAAREQAKQARIAEAEIRRHELLSDSRVRKFGRHILESAHLPVPAFLKPSESKFRRSDRFEKASIHLARSLGERLFHFPPLGYKRLIDVLFYEGPDNNKIVFVAEEAETELREHIYTAITPKSLQKTVA